MYKRARLCGVEILEHLSTGPLANSPCHTKLSTAAKFESGTVAVCLEAIPVSLSSTGRILATVLTRTMHALPIR
jgi:hypothetical protein